MLLVRSLSRSEPLQSSAFARCLEVNCKVNQFALGNSIRHGDMKRGTEGCIVTLQFPLGLLRVDTDSRNVHITRVKDNLLTLLISLRFKLQNDRALERLLLKVDLEVGGSMARAPSAIVRKSTGIPIGRHVNSCKGASEVVRDCNLTSSQNGGFLE